MKKLSLLISLVTLSACATSVPIPQDISDRAAQISISDLPQNIHLEKMRCSKSRYSSLDKRMDCKIEVRRELAARQIMREQKTLLEAQGNEANKN